MRDVAHRAGVSLTTVSHVLNKTRYTAPETEKRVLEVVQELNYYKNVHARRLAMAHSDLLGLVISEIANPYFPEIIKSFQSAAWDHGYDVLLCNTEHDSSRARSAIQKLLESDVRGVAVITSAIERNMMRDLTASGAALVFSNSGPPDRLVSNVVIDYASGVAKAIEYMVSLGHRSFAVIAGPQTNRTALAIKDAFVSGLERQKLFPCPVLDSNFRVDGGASAVRVILSQTDVPTVIFCGNDLIAMGAMSALEEAGVRVPEDVSVVGFDDIFFASLARPPLTTIRVPRERLGALAFEALEKILSLKRRTGSEYSLSTELVVRKSTASPRKHALRGRKRTGPEHSKL
jgi:LacI family transcriptional regulator